MNLFGRLLSRLLRWGLYASKVEGLKCILEGLQLETFGFVSQCYPKLFDLVVRLFDSEVVYYDRGYLRCNLVSVNLGLQCHLTEKFF